MIFIQIMNGVSISLQKLDKCEINATLKSINKLCQHDINMIMHLHLLQRKTKQNLSQKSQE